MGTYDAIVIGSGIGGLTAAGLLARVAKKRVLVLERHIEPGGLTHCFRRNGASWDVGIHYIGQMDPESPSRQYLDLLTGGALQWNRMPDGFERFIYPDMEFVVPSDPMEYQAQLMAQFPDEGGAIRRYFRDIKWVTRWITLRMASGMTPPWIAPILIGLGTLTNRMPLQTTKQYLERRFCSPQLRALLASQWGDYGLPPSKSAFAIHALIVNHYLQGGWFPRGGSAQIARMIERQIEHRGGAVRVGQHVSRILIEQGRAVGVHVHDIRGGDTGDCIYRAPLIISDAGARVTFESLLPKTGKIGRRTAKLRKAIAAIGHGTSVVTVYLQLTRHIHSIGLNGENLWIYTGLDHDAMANKAAAALVSGQPSSAFVSFPSVKAGEQKHHTAEIIAFIDANAFEPWKRQPKGQRDTEYLALKTRIGAGLIDLVDQAVPGFGALVDRFEVATPLTIEHYTAHPQGAFYGLPATPRRYQAKPLGPRTPIPGLLLSGQDAGELGIMGAVMGGVAAASHALGPRGFSRINRALGTPTHQMPDRSSLLPPDKYRVTITQKDRLTPSIWQLTLAVDGEVQAWKAGQFARLRVHPYVWRDYSIVSLDGNELKLLVSTRTGGHGSQFIEQIAAGVSTTAELPLGHYQFIDDDTRPIFIATGTGIAPFIPMFRQLDDSGQLKDATLLFGSRGSEDDLLLQLDIPLPGRYIRCYSRHADTNARKGRVTDMLHEYLDDIGHSSFYICGSAAMVNDSAAYLRSHGAHHLYVEAF
ncbi:FAD-dependent oxidoreductase [Stomatohabitans albus]|uniref:FAD-dependent oxidoreductase n=1 Tax=Stomatohabitans albus TaxID=3110766 RepID=UPI00300CE2CB